MFVFLFAFLLNQSMITPSNPLHFTPQRPSAKELLKFPFIKKAKKTSYLIELIEKFKRFKVSGAGESDSESEESDSYVFV